MGGGITREEVNSLITGWDVLATKQISVDISRSSTSWGALKLHNAFSGLAQPGYAIVRFRLKDVRVSYTGVATSGYLKLEFGRSASTTSYAYNKDLVDFDSVSKNETKNYTSDSFAPVYFWYFYNRYERDIYHYLENYKESITDKFYYVEMAGISGTFNATVVVEGKFPL